MATILTGKYEYQMDSKGRVILPVEFRDAFTVNGVSEIHLYSVHDRILILTKDGMNKLLSEFENQSLFDKDSLDSSTLFFANLMKVSINPDGRITIPPTFRKDASLDKKVIVVGAGNRAEIWSIEKWTERFGEGTKKLGDSMQAVHNQKFRRDVNLNKKDQSDSG
jgi:MraZ protein